MAVGPGPFYPLELWYCFTTNNSEAPPICIVADSCSIFDRRSVLLGFSETNEIGESH